MSAVSEAFSAPKLLSMPTFSEALFDHLDVNKDGVVTREEWQRAMQAFLSFLWGVEVQSLRTSTLKLCPDHP